MGRNHGGFGTDLVAGRTLVKHTRLVVHVCTEDTPETRGSLQRPSFHFTSLTFESGESVVPDDFTRYFGCLKKVSKRDGGRI